MGFVSKMNSPLRYDSPGATYNCNFNIFVLGAMKCDCLTVDAGDKF